MPRVSIVIPAYNAELYLEETLNSVLNSTYRDYEVVVINDGSKDKTGEIASKFTSNVRVINQLNAGISASRNRGIESGDSEFIALLDSDDLWHPQKLQLQIDALESHQDYHYSFTGFVFWDGCDSKEFMNAQRKATIDDGMSGWIYHKLILDNAALPSSLIFRRSAWAEMGPFLCNDQQTDDWEFIVRSSYSHRFIRLSEPMVLYRQLPQSLSRRLPKINTPELMRESLITRFGICSPGGAEIDKSELERRRYLGWSNFADAHCARGNLSEGLKIFSDLLMRGPRRGKSLERLVKSVGRRYFPKGSSKS